MSRSFQLLYLYLVSPISHGRLPLRSVRRPTVVVHFDGDIFRSVLVAVHYLHEKPLLYLRGEPDNNGFLVRGDVPRFLIKLVLH